ncbi:type II toxin-antitoxin system RelE/ParE family toxin [Cellvibrio sp. KY-GH-1]|uniref:type II toxin-antitoxin system RelE/ParE family toxin n=1 Tax=Cellvibrio sp. KY-GH-1 TaxID=2303332 RepID=UPI001CDA08CE
MGSSTAKAIFKWLRSALNQLAENPLMGTLRCSADQIYSFPYVSHMVYYQTQKDHIIILAVLHQSMTPEIHSKKE